MKKILKDRHIRSYQDVSARIAGIEEIFRDHHKLKKRD